MFCKWVQARRAARKERLVFAELHRMAIEQMQETTIHTVGGLLQMQETTYCVDCDGNCEVCQSYFDDCD